MNQSIQIVKASPYLTDLGPRWRCAGCCWEPENVSQLSEPTISQSISQLISQSINQSVNQILNSLRQALTIPQFEGGSWLPSLLLNQSINQSINKANPKFKTNLNLPVVYYFPPYTLIRSLCKYSSLYLEEYNSM